MHFLRRDGAAIAAHMGAWGARGALTRLEKCMGNLGLDPQERWMCVCEGGREASSSSFPWKLEEDLSHKSEYTSPISH